MLSNCPPRASPVRHSVRRPSRAPVSAALRPAMPLPATTRSNSSAMPPSFPATLYGWSARSTTKIGEGIARALDRFSLQHRVDHLERVARVAVLWVDREIAAIRGGGVFHPLQLDVDQAHAGDRAEMPWLEFQGAADIVERFLVLAHQVIQRGAPVPAFREVGLFFDDAVEGLKRLRIVALAHFALAFGHQPVDLLVAREDPDRPDFRFEFGRGVRVGRGFELVEQRGQTRVFLVGPRRAGDDEGGENSEAYEQALHAASLTRRHIGRHNDGVMATTPPGRRGGAGRVP